MAWSEWKNAGGLSLKKIGAFNGGDNWNSKITEVTIDVKSILSNYASLSASDFFIEVTSCNGFKYGSSGDITTTINKPNVSYNSNTGTLTISPISATNTTKGWVGVCLVGSVYYIESGTIDYTQ